MDNSWAALANRLESYASLPAEVHPDAVRAAALAKRLFPTGLSFLRLPYAEEWSESAKRLRMIEDDGIAADIERIAGPEFLAEVRRAHSLYGAALGMTKPASAVDDVSLAAPLRGVQQAIVNLALKVMASADDEDPDSIAMVRAALAPIDAHRAGAARRAGAGEAATPPVDPNTPVPEVPAPPA